MTHPARRGADWGIEPADPLTGAELTDEELAYRERIRDEAEQGLFAVSSRYVEVADAIHRPMGSAQGTLAGEDWVLERPGRVTLTVPLPPDLGSARRQDLAVQIARLAGGEFAAEVMLALFALANDPPYWRRPAFQVRMGDLLDRLNFARDGRGVHRSDARRRLSQTLLALHFTHVGVDQGINAAGKRLGYLAPLLVTLAYSTEQDIGNRSPAEVFAAGLPDEIGIAIHPMWYEGLSGHAGYAANYALLPRTQHEGPRRRGGQSPVLAALRAYVRERAAEHRSHGRCTISRGVLIAISGTRDTNPRQAGRTLTRALDALCAEGVLVGYTPQPLPSGAEELITLRWAIQVPDQAGPESR